VGSSQEAFHFQVVYLILAGSLQNTRPGLALGKQKSIPFLASLVHMDTMEHAAVHAISMYLSPPLSPILRPL
jgi:hypothetical protein